MSDYDKYASATMESMSTKEKQLKYEQMKSEVDYSKDYYGHNGYWAALYDSLECWIRSK
jgi:hypothetical protein